MDEAGVINNIIVDVPLVEDLLIVHSVSVGKLIGLSSQIDLGLSHVLTSSLRKFEAIDESGVTNDVIISVVDVLNFLIVGLVTVGETIRLSLQVDESLWCLYSLKRIDLRS